MSKYTSTAERPQGRPRSEEREQAIIHATISLLAKNSYADVSIEAIAQQAGVSKATIYRRWSNKVDLVVDVLLRQALAPQTSFSHLPLRQMLFASMKGCYEGMLKGPLSHAIAAVLSEVQVDPKLRSNFYNGFFAKLQEIGISDLSHAVDKGELRHDINKEVLIDQLFGPLYYRVLIAHKPVDDDYLHALIDNVMGGVCR